MKAALYSSTGEKKADIELPKSFSAQIREDIAAKYFEAEKFLLMQPYSTYEEAGKRHSASGTISHRRHKWKGHYGKGISRAPRKKMWRRGTQFHWIGAETSQSRGGRVAHPPFGIHRYRKINKKEKIIAINSGLSSTLNKNYISQRYSSLASGKPAVSAAIESLPSKTKELLSVLKKMFGDSFGIVLRKKEVRAGRGKSRGRKYKANAGLLIIKGKNEPAKFSGFDIKSIDEIRMRDLYPLGRLALYTKQALEELEKAGGKK